MKQTVTITRAGQSDGWGGYVPGQTITLPCRVDERTQVVQNQFGEEVVSSAEIMFSGLAEIYYSDTITYEDELGRKIERQPVRIEPVRWFNGKARLTVVYV